MGTYQKCETDPYHNYGLLESKVIVHDTRKDWSNGASKRARCYIETGSSNNAHYSVRSLVFPNSQF